MIPRNTPAPIQDAPILQWASGKTEARALDQARFAGFTGFHSAVGRDAACDAACAAAGVAQLDIRHPRASGPSEIKRHWQLGERICFHPLTAGPPAPSVAAYLARPNAQRTAEAGIGLAWPNGEKSPLAVRGFLLIGDAALLVQLSVRSTMTDALLAALLDHYRVCAAADAIIDRVKHPDPVAFHELTLPLGAGAEVAAGKGDKTSQISPLASGHPAAITREYIVSIWRAKALHEAALAAWPGGVAWAAGYRSGELGGELEAAAEDAAPARRGRLRICAVCRASGGAHGGGESAAVGVPRGHTQTARPARFCRLGVFICGRSSNALRLAAPPR